MLKAVLFDMDGVIIDSEPYHYQVEMSVMRDLGLSVSREEYLSWAGTTSRTMYGLLKERHGLKPSVEELYTLNQERYMAYLRSLPELSTVPGALGLIRRLSAAGLPLALASSSPLPQIRYVLDRLELTALFPVVASGDEVPGGKPEPDIFLLAARRLRLPPESCLVIEDSTHGVRAARRAGMRCVGLDNPNSAGQDLAEADLVVGSLEEITMEGLQALWG